ncbi:hypothetical protein LP414_06130 [Polaromonas sp. P1(28)-13]|nr:hypothetical protein LP414_06130 [Polaromonas sp. P1(28)-13]
MISNAVFRIDGDVADIQARLVLWVLHDELPLMVTRTVLVFWVHRDAAAPRFGLAGLHAPFRVFYMATLGMATGMAGTFATDDDALDEWLVQKRTTISTRTLCPRCWPEHCTQAYATRLDNSAPPPRRFSR